MSSGVLPFIPSQNVDKDSVLATIGGVGRFFRDAPGLAQKCLDGKWSVDAEGVVFDPAHCPVIWYSS